MSVAKAVVLGFDGYERIILVSDPPPREWRMAVTLPMSIDTLYADVTTPMYSYRMFQLRTDLRSLEHGHRWQKMYNESRTCTLEPGYVYMEVRS